MATRGGQQVDLVWALVDLTASQVDAFFATTDALHRSRLPTTLLSINRSIGWNAVPPTGLRQALVKIATTEANMNAALTPGAAAAIIRVYTEADHHEAVTLVTDIAWAGTI